MHREGNRVAGRGLMEGEVIYTNPFPPSNIRESAIATRHKTTTLCDHMWAVQAELRMMVSKIMPQFSVDPGLPAVETISPGLVLRLDSTVPPALGTVGHSGHEGRRI